MCEEDLNDKGWQRRYHKTLDAFWNNMIHDDSRLGVLVLGLEKRLTKGGHFNYIYRLLEFIRCSYV